MRKAIKNQGIRYASGMDLLHWIPVASAVCFILIYLFAPMITIPKFSYQGYPDSFCIWNIQDCFFIFDTLYPYHNMTLLLEEYSWLTIVFCLLVIVDIISLVSFLVGFFIKQNHIFKMGKIIFLYTIFVSLVMLVLLFSLNMNINHHLNIENTFLNLTVNGYLSITSFPYALLLLSILCFLKLDLFFNISSSRKKRGIKKKTRFIVVLLFILIPCIIIFGFVFLNNRSYYFISLCIIFVAMIPFFVDFEEKRYPAREIILISVMVVMATLGRTIFFMLPNFKPTTAIVIIAGIGLGREAGFLTGALTGFISNFLFGQGPWTPWQMFAFGLIGFLSGMIFKKQDFSKKSRRVNLVVYSVFVTIFIYGFIMDTSSGLMYLSDLNWKSFFAIYISGLPINITHACSTAIFTYVLVYPFIKKINRIRLKYGLLMEGEELSSQ